MQLPEASKLIQHSISQNKTVWADLGCGDGLFTKALSQLLTKGSIIYAVDKNGFSLNKVMANPGIELTKITADFIQDELPIENLSGIMMANSFHYVKDKKNFIQKLIKCLSDDGYFLLVEYDTGHANTWVPYPISFRSLDIFFSDLNFSVRKLHQLASRYNGTIYSAIIKR